MFFRLENIKHLSQIYQQNIIHFFFSNLFTAETLENKSYTFSLKKKAFNIITNFTHYVFIGKIDCLQTNQFESFVVYEIV